jgi:hypothetical protein
VISEGGLPGVSRGVPASTIRACRLLRTPSAPSACPRVAAVGPRSAGTGMGQDESIEREVVEIVNNQSVTCPFASFQNHYAFVLIYVLAHVTVFTLGNP